MDDVIIIGGGVIGLTLADELAGQGVSCAVLDQGALGQESSWAGAGILPPGRPSGARTPEARLRAASHVLWPGLSARLRDETGIDNGFRRCGGIEVRLSGPAEALDQEVAAWRQEQVEVTPLKGNAAQECEPSLAPVLAAAYHLPELGQVRNPRHVQALIASAARRGVRLLPGAAVTGFARSGNRIASVDTGQGSVQGGQFVVASGAWTDRVLRQVGRRVDIRPWRGQIVLLRQEASRLRQVVNIGPRYLVPRGDGRVLVGSTEEDAGFDKRTTASGVGGLIELALAVVPELASAAVEKSWAGLRPMSADGLPYLGRVPDVDNLFVAAGHFRSGLQLSPITARLMADLLLDRSASLPLEPYAVERSAP